MTGAGEVLIRVADLTRVYQVGGEEVRAVDGVDLEIAKGEYVAIMGASGSGKSTLMNLIGCLDTPSSGTYVLNGAAVAEMDDDALAAVRNREIGFVFQTFNLLPRLTAAQNVELPLIYGGVGAAERRERVAKVMAQVGLTDSTTHKVATALTWLRANFTQPMHVEELANLAHMSLSAFYQAFQAVTSMSPLQYQKALRLQEARRLMMSSVMDAASAGQQVGYLSASQFGREYARFFGQSPARDIARLVEQGAGQAVSTP